MTVLNIRHRTTYRYREPVRLGPHRLMLRPRESRDVRLLSSTLEMTPAASVSWTNDVFGNAVATAGFAGLADGLIHRKPGRGRARRLGLAGVRHRRLGHPLPVLLFERGAGRSRGAGGAADLRCVGPARRLGAGFRARYPYRYAGAAQGHGGGCGGGDRLPEPRGRGHADAIANHRSRLGLVPRLRRAVRRGGALPGLRRAYHLGLSLQSGSRTGAGRIGPEGSAMGRARPMRGPRSSCRARAGSPSIRPTARSAATISFRSPSAASSPR